MDVKLKLSERNPQEHQTIEERVVYALLRVAEQNMVRFAETGWPGSFHRAEGISEAIEAMTAEDHETWMPVLRALHELAEKHHAEMARWTV